MDFRKKTLQDASSARAVQEAFLNKSGVSTDTVDDKGKVVTRRKMSRDDAEQAKVFAGQMHSRIGGDAGAFGNLAGMIPSMERADRVSGDDVKRRMMQMYRLGEKGGASPAQFAEQISGASYLSSTGAYRDPARMAAVGSALSIASPSEIGTGLDQMHRLTTGSLQDMTAPPGAKMKPAEYLKSIGANDQQDDLDILKRMFADAEREEGESKKRGQQLNISTYLRDRGYSNIQDTGRFSQLYGSRKDLSDVFEPMAAKMPTLAEANDPFEKLKGSIQGRKQASDLMTDRAKLTMGTGAMEYMQALESNAFNAMQAKGSIVGSLEDYRGSMTLRDTMFGMQRSEMKARGIKENPADLFFTGEMAYRGQPGSKETAEQLYERGIQINQGDGDPMASSSTVMRGFEKTDAARGDMNDRQERQMTELIGAVKANRPPPGPAPAAVQLARPGGANAGLAR